MVLMSPPVLKHVELCMTISRSHLDQQVFAGIQPRSENIDPLSTEGAPSPRAPAPPFDEPIYTVNEAAKILRLGPNQVREIFRKEPGVHDLSADSAKSRFLKRRSQLRIPHAVLMRFWKPATVSTFETGSHDDGPSEWRSVVRAWTPYMLLVVLVIAWGTSWTARWLVNAAR